MKLYSITYFNQNTGSIYTGLTAGFKELNYCIETTIAEESTEEATELDIKNHQKQAKKTLKECKDQFDSGFTYSTSPNTYVCIQELTFHDLVKANNVYKHTQLKQKLKRIKASC